MPKKYTPMAIIYDFDGTLAPGNIQEHQFIPAIKMQSRDFWEEVNKIAKDLQADPILMYMRLMLEKAKEAKISVRKRDFRKHGRTITFFNGVPEWFDRIEGYAKGKQIKIEHYIISSGNAEIIESTLIASKFEKIYASRFVFDENGVACWPAVAINYTTKTQFLFRINKSAHDISDNEAVNKFISKECRPMPFENMIYIGDGETDIPCLRLVKDLGGLSIAVYKPFTKRAQEKAQEFFEQDRVHAVTPAIYQDGSKLDSVVKAQIDFVAARTKRKNLMGS